MRWVDTPSAGRSGFVGSRLMTYNDGYLTPVSVAEVARHGATYYVEFTRFAPKDAQTDHQREFMSLAAAKAYAVAVLRLL